MNDMDMFILESVKEETPSYMQLINILKAIDQLLIKLEQKKDWGIVTELGKIREMLLHLEV
jgi:hypothetical protein